MFMLVSKHTIFDVFGNYSVRLFFGPKMQSSESKGSESHPSFSQTARRRVGPHGALEMEQGAPLSAASYLLFFRLGNTVVEPQ